jgi:hypothetical protein
MPKRKSTKGQTTIYKTLHRKLKTGGELIHKFSVLFLGEIFKTAKYIGETS